MKIKVKLITYLYHLFSFKHKNSNYNNKIFVIKKKRLLKIKSFKFNIK